MSTPRADDADPSTTTPGEQERLVADLHARVHAAELAISRLKTDLETQRAAERTAFAAAERARGALDVRERELAAARIEATGATDAIAKLQHELGAARAGIAQAQLELHAERVRLGTAEALLRREREQHETRAQEAAAQAHATLTATQEEHRSALAIERASFAQERATLEQRLSVVQAQGEAQTQAEHAATVALQGELDASRRRAEAIEHELARRDEVVTRLSHTVRGVRSDLEQVREQLEAEQRACVRTADAAQRVLAAASPLLPRAARVPPATAAPAERRAGGPRSGNLSDLLERFDQIRSQLADHGIGAPAPSEDLDA